ncbi:MAG: response regulator [Chloroflexota bacterium]|nr:response regulator [Anaerolineae bacterium]HMM28658.1 response regulator [Aggregatilineaceae bacterium]
MPTWMVVEDEPDIYELLLAMFEIWGIQGVAFVDGPEAVAWIDDVDQGRVRGELPEVALLDVRLPQLSGPHVAQRLRRSPALGQVGIVLITAYRLSPEDEKLVMAEAQADLLLFKPLPSLAELREMIERVIVRRKQAQLVPPAATSLAPAPEGLAPAAPPDPPAPPVKEAVAAPEPGAAAPDADVGPRGEEGQGVRSGESTGGDDAEH